MAPSGTFWAMAFVALAGGCTLDDGRPPLARIEIAPPSIPENDGFATAVTLDGTTSADPVDDPDGIHGLDFAWEVTGDEVRFEPGSRAGDEAPVIRLRGDRPATITLTVTDVDGLSASATARIQLTVL